ncbi:MAG TPA: TldD/PmbA family protein [Candidatus Baltobacteraceae bacterium]|jgi:PmbA protein
MDAASAVAFARDAVDSALAAGASQAEATFSVSDRFSTEARDSTITKLERSTGKSLQVRLFVDGRRGSLGTSDFEREHLRAAIADTIAAARHVAHDEFAGLPESAGRDMADQSDLELYSEEIVERDTESKIAEVTELERLVRSADSRIENSNGSHYGDSITTIALANSLGFAGAYRSTRASRSSSPVARDGESKRTGAYGTAARRLTELESLGDVAQKAARRTVEMFGARKPQTGRLPVIFERDVAASVLSDLFAALSASNVAIGNSWLADRVGTSVGSDLVSIVDDGTLRGLLGSSPFDGEGVPTQRTAVFERGTCRTLLYDTYYARKLGAFSTGNSSGGGIGPNNFYLEPGTWSLDELIARTKRGVLVLDTIGFATEHASGIYSRGARGFAIEDGALAYPIDEFTIASSFPEMLAGVDGIADDLRFDGAVVSPSFRVAEMTISGN